MTYESAIGRMPVISDANAHHFVDPVVAGHTRYCALKPRDIVKYPHGGTGFAAMRPFKQYSKDEVVARIEQRDRNRSGLRHILDSKKVPVKDQDGTNYCWIYATVHTMECMYAVQGDGYVPLSATAAGTMITGGQNRGGYGAEGIDWLSKNGTCREEDWREYAMNPRLWTPEIQQIAQQNKITDWGELPPGNLDQAVACLLNNFPITVGLSWWRHQITLIDVVMLAGGVIGFVFDNSWSTRWGDNGRGVLTPEKARGDMFYPLTVSPTR